MPMMWVWLLSIYHETFNRGLRKKEGLFCTNPPCSTRKEIEEKLLDITGPYTGFALLPLVGPEVLLSVNDHIGWSWTRDYMEMLENGR